MSSPAARSAAISFGCSRATEFATQTTGDGRFIEVQGTAEGPPFERKALDDLLELADAGIRELVTLQRSIVGDIRA